MPPKVSILCVTYNRRELALRCLKSCVEQNYPNLEIIVVVNPSGDGTEESISKAFPQTQVIRTHKNIGFFPALNLAIANSVGDYLMTIDDDAHFIDNHAITHLVSVFEKEPVLGAVTCSLVGPYEKPPEASDRYIDVFTTGFTMLPRKAFTEWVGYYPDLFFRSVGETYISSQLWELGRPVKRLSHVRMYHERAMEGRSDWDWKFHALRSQILCALMRDPWYLVVPHLLSIKFKSFFQYLRWGHFWMWISAWLSAFYHIPQALHYRHPIGWKTQRRLWRLRKKVVSQV